jgi:HK97 gp10 family phage protein
MILTAEELLQKLDNLKAGTMPAIEQAMQMAALNVEGQAKKNANPGTSPYEGMVFPTKWKGGYQGGAPYSDDANPNRIPPHLRDSIISEVVVEGNSVHGVVGTQKPYALPVHEGTSRMPARPFILDAITEKDTETRTILSDALAALIRSQCE